MIDYEELELTDEMIERNDDIDNSVYQCILMLIEKDEDSFPWDIHIIGELTDVIEDVLWNRFGLKIRHPAVVTEPDGTQYYSEYYYDDDTIEIIVTSVEGS